MTTEQKGSPNDPAASARSCLVSCVAGIAALAIGACLAPQALAGSAEHPLYQRTGTASWYGRYHQGRRMADGRRFNMNKLTAAHRSLPLATTARVINLENGREVKVRITDRGPYHRGRIIDLSARAARELGMRKDGVAPVKVEVLASDQAVALSSND